MNRLLFDLVVAPLISIGVLFICVILIQLIQRSRFLSIWFLGFVKSNK